MKTTATNGIVKNDKAKNVIDMSPKNFLIGLGSHKKAVGLQKYKSGLSPLNISK
jgi:hypothetical protein